LTPVLAKESIPDSWHHTIMTFAEWE